jgi:hypothetical protein
MNTFDNYAEHYDKWFETGLGKFVADCETELILKLAGPKSGEKALSLFRPITTLSAYPWANWWKKFAEASFLSGELS